MKYVVKALIFLLVIHYMKASAGGDSIFDCITKGDFEGFKRKAESVDLSRQDEDGRTPLHLVVRNGKHEMADFLLQHKAVKAFIDTPDKFNQSPLFRALYNRMYWKNRRNQDMVKKHKVIVFKDNQKVHVETCGIDGQAIVADSTFIATKLLEAGADDARGLSIEHRGEVYTIRAERLVAVMKAANMNDMRLSGLILQYTGLLQPTLSQIAEDREWEQRRLAGAEKEEKRKSTADDEWEIV